MTTESKCPFHATPVGGSPIRDSRPEPLWLDLLNQHSSRSNPLDDGFDCPKAFKSVDHAAQKPDLASLMTDSEHRGPADFGQYGGLFVRLAWHSAGT